ncbi:hypothetical protein NDU88_001423 [Pleurodeles waltl]|uniref:Uncharacterized protein n=1 Tax=Pleurodeles waltl TaxID=8319 RepID=A0AAV7P703_PLEWA|nr:hypothetical protein NDU88_001423 [Pleurodeles waltl]
MSAAWYLQRFGGAGARSSTQWPYLTREVALQRPLGQHPAVQIPSSHPEQSRGWLEGMPGRLVMAHAEAVLVCHTDAEAVDPAGGEIQAPSVRRDQSHKRKRPLRMEHSVLSTK